MKILVLHSDIGDNAPPEELDTLIAADAVAEVQGGGDPVHLKAMNPFERKIVHDAVASAGLTSESEGVEPNRYVVVLPKA